MTIHNKVSGSFQDVNLLYANLAGTWTEMEDAWVKVGGTWRQTNGKITATGGDSVVDANGYRFHVFNSSANLTVTGGTGNLFVYQLNSGAGGEGGGFLSGGGQFSGFVEAQGSLGGVGGFFNVFIAPAVPEGVYPIAVSGSAGFSSNSNLITLWQNVHVQGGGIAVSLRANSLQLQAFQLSGNRSNGTRGFARSDPYNTVGGSTFNPPGASRPGLPLNNLQVVTPVFRDYQYIQNLVNVVSALGGEGGRGSVTAVETAFSGGGQPITASRTFGALPGGGAGGASTTNPLGAGSNGQANTGGGGGGGGYYRDSFGAGSGGGGLGGSGKTIIGYKL